MASESSSAVRSATKWTLVASGAGAVLLIVFNLLLTRTASPAAVGLVFAMLSMAAILTNVVQLGLHTTALRLVSTAVGQGDVATARGLARKILFVVVVNGTLMCLIAALAYAVFPSQVAEMFGGSGALVFATLAMSLLSGVRVTLVSMDRAFERNARAALAGNVVPLLLQVLCLVPAVLLLEDAPAMLLVAVVVFSQVLALAVSAVLSWSDVMGSNVGPSMRPSKAPGTDSAHRYSALYWSGLLFFVNALVFSAFSQLGVVYVHSVGPPEEVAVYGLAARLMLSANTPIMMFTQFLSPIIAREINKADHGEANEVLQTGATLAFLYGFAVLAIMLVVGKPLISLVFGAYYVQSWLPLVILLVGQALSYLIGFGTRTLEMAGWQKAALVPGLFALGTACVAVLFLYPAMGVTGVALSIAIGQVLSRLLACLLAWRLFGVVSIGFRFGTFRALVARMRQKR